MLKKIFWLQPDNAQYYTGFFAVILAGTLWSCGAVLVRFMVDSEQYQFQYLFYRGLAIGSILLFYLFLREGRSCYKNFQKVGISGFIGALSLCIAMLSFILSITTTTVAVTLLMLALMPFMTAVLGFFIIKEKIRPLTMLSMIIAMIGVFFMIRLDQDYGSLLGLFYGFCSAVGFSIFTISLRWRKETPKFTTVALAGFFCSIFAIIAIVLFDDSFAMPRINMYLSFSHGTVVAIGMIFYSLGAKHIPAAELTLLSLMEVVGGIFLVWLPVIGINEVPANGSIIGGFILVLAVVIHGVGAKRKYTPPLQ